METPILTNERVHSIVQSEVMWMNSRLMNVREQLDDSGIQIVRFGNATAFVNQSLSGNPVFNRVLGLTAQDESSLDAILKWHYMNGVPCRIDLCPYQANQDLLLAFAKYGLHQSSYETVLYGIPSPRISPPSQHIVVRQVYQQELDLYADLYAQGFLEFYEGLDVNLKLVGEYGRRMYGFPGWQLYLAFVEETPAAVALLYIQGQVASLVAGATVPQFRNKGCQFALIQQRIADAVDAGCTLVVTQTKAGTASQRNMERAGLRVAYTKAIWETLET